MYKHTHLYEKMSSCNKKKKNASSHLGRKKIKTLIPI